MAFLKLIEDFKVSEVINSNIVNDLIIKHYPEKEFLGPEDKRCKVLIKKLVAYEMERIDPSQLEGVLPVLNSVYHVLFPHQPTLDKYFSTDIRSVLTKRFGYDSNEHKISRDLVRIANKERSTMVQNETERLKQKNCNRSPITVKIILGIIQENILSKDPYRRAIALLLACGSRPIEFFSKSTYELFKDPDDPNNLQWIKQSCIAKTRDTTKTVIKPIVGMTSVEFLLELKNVKDAIKVQYPNTTLLSESYNRLNVLISNRLNILAKQIFNYEKDTTLYVCRKLYALVSHKIYGGAPSIHGTQLDYHYWATRVLGHAKEWEATKNYCNFYISDDDSSLFKPEDPFVDPYPEEFKKLKELMDIMIFEGDYAGQIPSQTKFVTRAKGICPRHITVLFYKNYTTQEPPECQEESSKESDLVQSS